MDRHGEDTEDGEGLEPLLKRLELPLPLRYDPLEDGHPPPAAAAQWWAYGSPAAAAGVGVAAEGIRPSSSRKGSYCSGTELDLRNGWGGGTRPPA